MERSRFFSLIAIILALCPLFSVAAEEGDDSEAYLAFEEEPQYFEYAVPRFTVSGTVGLNSGESFAAYDFLFQPYFQVDTTQFTAYSGLQLAKNDLDAVASGVWWPWHSNRMRAGVGALYHFNYYDHISISNDLFFGVYFQTRPAEWFGLKVDTSYFYKARTILAIRDKTPVLSNNSLSFSLETDFYLPYNCMVFTKVSSYELHRYMVFCAPTFSIGFVVETPSDIFFAVEAAARYIDFFTASAYYDDSEIRITVGMHF